MTEFAKIYKLFAGSVTDTYLKKLAESIDGDKQELLEDILETLLVRAVAKFTDCVKPLDFDLTTKSFASDLDTQEQVIICDLMILSWLERNNNNTTMMNLKLNDTDFKHASESLNLREKSDYTDKWREKVNQDIVNYSLKHAPWEEWVMGRYDLHNQH